jgi:UDP-3-O-[3-hydroxymyristoyl] glucosamine N-acyltransferase
VAGGPGFRLAELAARVGGTVRGDSERAIDGIAGLEEAGPGELAFLTDPRFRGQAAASRAGALGVSPREAGRPELAGRDLLVAADPPLARAELLALLHPPAAPAPGVHPTAVVGSGCDVDPTAHLGPFVVVGEGSTIGGEAVLSAHVGVGRGCRVGPGCLVHPHAVLYDGTELGAGSIVHAGAVLGADGFGYVTRQGRHHKVPQVGRVVVDEEVEIGANAAVDRATLGATRIGAGSKIDNLVQVGHNVQVGRSVLLCGQAGIAGSTRLGDGVVVGGQGGVADHVDLGAGVQVAGGSAVYQSTAAGAVGGVPAMELGLYRRVGLLLKRLPELFRRVRALERRLGEEERGE